MQFSYYRPRHPLLSDLIEGYYFLRGSRPDSTLSYYTFPNNYSILSMLVDSRISVRDDRVFCFGDSGAPFHCNLTCHYTEPLLIQYAGEVNEVTIYFKPLGLHAFLSFSSGYDEVANFSAFRPFADLESTMRSGVLTGDRERQIDTLESYLISKRTLTIDPVLLRLRDLVEGDADIGAIADELGYSRQYVSRLFSRHFGKSPSVYRKIQRFRNVIKTRHESVSMTALGLDNMFYDQSHFIREFKELTLLSPKKFFDKVDAGEGILWLYI